VDAVIRGDRVDEVQSDGQSRPGGGEWEVRGDERAETRFHSRTGLAGVVP
jgi:hypothetical protein